MSKKKQDMDEKIIETSLENLISRVQDLKNSLSSFLFKLEHEQLNWPQMLDNFALLSGQISTLNKLIKNDRLPTLRNLVLLPISVSMDRDEQIEKITEGRIQAFSHEVVPDALRTKYEPDVEKEEQRLTKKAAEISPEEAQKQIENLNDLASTMIEKITDTETREDWEAEVSSHRSIVTPSSTDTTTLVAAVTNGHGLRKRSSSSSVEPDSKSSGSDSMRGKVPSSLKTGIRTSTAASTHPYSTSSSQRSGPPTLPRK